MHCIQPKGPFFCDISGYQGPTRRGKLVPSSMLTVFNHSDHHASQFGFFNCSCKPASKHSNEQGQPKNVCSLGWIKATNESSIEAARTDYKENFEQWCITTPAGMKTAVENGVFDLVAKVPVLNSTSLITV